MDVFVADNVDARVVCFMCAAADLGIIVFPGYKQCSDGILNPGEECDDGNLIPNDGCSADCKLESATLFLCVNVTTFGPTECCPARINPITSQQVCDCKTQASDNPGYTISADCRWEYTDTFCTRTCTQNKN